MKDSFEFFRAAGRRGGLKAKKKSKAERRERALKGWETRRSLARARMYRKKK